MEIDFDPARISYEDLLDVFWAEHDPETLPYSRQYMSIIFYHDEKQKAAAEASGERQQKQRSHPIKTQIFPASVFYLAEGYHQKYYLRGVPELVREFEASYPVERDFIDSTATARANGYLAGYGTLADVEATAPAMGLSEAGKGLLLEIARSRYRPKVPL